MTIDEAIEILSESAYRGSTTFDQRFKAAEKLGIEALKRVKSDREHHYRPKSLTLPGETEE